MTGIKINFDGSMALDLSASVSGDTAEMQNCLVNIACERGTDPMWPERGTTLLRKALSGAIVGANSAMHASNFAAVDTLFFTRATSDHANPLQRVQLEPVVYNNQKLELAALFEFSDGRRYGAKALI